MKGKYSITRGMMGTFSKRRKTSCPSCGLVIPIYRGRYPRHCPSCGERFGGEDVIEQVVDPLPYMYQDQIVVDPDTELGVILDDSLQYINIHDLLDMYLGSEINSNEKSVTLYFSHYVKEDTLQELADSISRDEYYAKVEKSNKSDAKWQVKVFKSMTGEPAEISGDVDHEVDIQGEVPIEKES